MVLLRFARIYQSDEREKKKSKTLDTCVDCVAHFFVPLRLKKYVGFACPCEEDLYFVVDASIHLVQYVKYEELLVLYSTRAVASSAPFSVADEIIGREFFGVVASQNRSYERDKGSLTSTLRIIPVLFLY